jgi:hypothetical protein
MNSSTTPQVHSLTFEVPTPRDYRNGGFGDLVAQCSCGAYEYVESGREGAYWHQLHLANPSVTKYGLLRLLVDNPMPEGWEESPEITSVIPATQPVAARVYTCVDCVGSGSVEAVGATGGRFYHLGERRQCPTCAGSGEVAAWPGAA